MTLTLYLGGGKGMELEYYFISLVWKFKYEGMKRSFPCLGI